MSKINFTKEHRDRLGVLAADALFEGTTFKGNLGSEHNIFTLFHNCTPTTLSRYLSTTKKEITDIEGLDEWSLTEHQQRKLSALKKQAELINLLIGYLRSTEEAEANRQKLATLKGEYAKLKESAKTPEEKLKDLEAEMAALETETA